MPLTRSQHEIVNRINEVDRRDFFGFETHDLINYLDFGHAKPWLKDGTTTDQWNVETIDPLDQVKEYMDFAWDKANNQRGLSAGRSISHMMAWLWLAGDDETVEKLENNLHGSYGKDALRYICEKYGLPILDT